MDESKERRTELVVTGGDAAKVLQFVEEALDEVALFVDRLLPAVTLLAIGFVGNIGDCALSPNAQTHVIGIVALVGDDDGFWIEPVEQGLGAGHVMVVARRQDQPDRAAFRIDPRVDLRGEASSASAHTTNSTVFLTPEAC